MSIEQHTGPDAASESSDAALAHVLGDLTRAVLDLPDAGVELPETGAAAVLDDLAPVLEEPATDPAAEPARERRPGMLLNELSFLDD